MDGYDSLGSDADKLRRAARREQQQVAVYVISLARASARRASITAHLDALGIAFELVDGVDGNALDQSYLDSVVAPDCGLTRGMIGCNLSHLEVSKRHLASGRAVALILEDDARLDPAVAAFVKGGVDPSTFDFCFLDCEDRNWQSPVFYDRDDGFTLAGGLHAHRLSAGPLKAHALLVTLAATAKRMKHMLPIRHCIDVYTDLPYAPRFYAVIAPRAAWLSEHSYESFTTPSGTNGGAAPSALAAWRQGALYYRVRDWIKLRHLRRLALARLLRSEEFLDPSRRWAPLPSVGNILR